MPDLYLIAHLVRGESTFDIAQRTEIAGEEAWINPTWGWRCYPWWTKALNTLGREGWGVYYEDDLWLAVPPCPQGWPDLFDAEPAPKGQGSGLLAKLGLLRPAPKLRRI